MTRVGFTGTGQGMTLPQRTHLAYCMRVLARERGGSFEAHHGDDQGADAEFHNLARDHGWRVVGHPPSNPRHRAFCQVDESRAEKPYLDRNDDIVAEAELMFATPLGMSEELRSGTWATIRRARKARRPLTIVWPDGTATRENH